MKGLNKKIHAEKWIADELRLKPKKLPMQGKVQAWRKAAGVGERWHDENPTYVDHNPNTLSHIACPECDCFYETKSLKLTVAVGFSTITCRECKVVVTSRLVV